MFDQNTNTWALPVKVTIGVDAQSAALTAMFIFIALLMALLIFGYLFKK